MFLCKTKMHQNQRKLEFGSCTLQGRTLSSPFWLHVCILLLHHRISIFQQRKKNRNKNIMAYSVQTLCFLCYFKNSCALQNIFLDLNAREITLPELLTSPHSKCWEFSCCTNRFSYKEKSYLLQSLFLEIFGKWSKCASLE